VTDAPYFAEHDLQRGAPVEDRLTSVRDLDWESFRSAYFPGSRRHDLEAIVAYSAYKRSLVAGDQQASEPAPVKADAHAIEAVAVDEWEDEGGTTQ
jgi:hypothetical protein